MTHLICHQILAKTRFIEQFVLSIISLHSVDLIFSSGETQPWMSGISK